MSEQDNEYEMDQLKNLHAEGMLSQAPCGKAPAKRPRQVMEEEAPDIEGYLDEFYLSDATKVGLLRTYANYLAAKLKAQKENELRD